ncbi:MAG TPA: hypothetical protein VEG60_24095 [Candidatus Binatia bacterium]|nr:hypothetical protein [Candidatus Binatia bacterium]
MATTAAAKATHDFGQVLSQDANLVLKTPAAAAALLGDTGHEL